MQPLRKTVPNEYPIMADWPDDSREGKDSQEENKVKDNFSDIKDGDLEKWKNLEMQELKNNNNQAPQPRPKSTSTSEIDSLTLQPSKCSIDWLGNQISVSSASEDSLEDID